MPDSVSRPVVLLDRDGTLIESVQRDRYHRRPADIALVQGVADVLSELQHLGARLAIVTNQQGLGLGVLTWAEYDAVARRTLDLLEESGVSIDAVYVCPHVEGTCDCRKPLPGLLLKALSDFAADPADAVMIGDSDADRGAARAAGVRFVRAPQGPWSRRTLRDIRFVVDAVPQPGDRTWL